MIHMFGDIEAYSLKYYRKHKQIKEYIVGSMDLTKEIQLFSTNIPDWLDQIDDLKESTTTWIHNLSGYDGHLILPHIFEKYNKKDIAYFMDEKAKIYNIKITRRYRDYNDLNEKGKPKRKKFTMTFADSYKIWPIPLSDIGQAVNKPKLDYGEYDIIDEFPTVETYMMHNEGKSWEYFVRDIEILVDFAEKTNDIMPLSDYKLTMASTAMNTWRKTNAFMDGVIRWSMKKKEEREGVSAWDTLYEDWRDVKQAYKGGFTWVNPKHQLKLLNNVWVYDINSMYPGIMINEPLPYGIGERDYDKLTDEHTYRLYRVKIKEATAINVPFIQTGKLTTDERVLKIMKYREQGLDPKEIDATYPQHLIDEEVMMNDYTYEEFTRSYFGQWDIEFVIGYKEKKGMFSKYISMFKDIKESNKGAIRLLAKLFLNSLYGKWGQNIEDKCATIEELADLDITYTDKAAYVDGQKITINGKYAYVKQDNGLKRNISYIPIAEAISSKARLQLIRAIKENWDSFVYCDTDSIHLLEPAKGIQLDANKFGDWAFEGCWTNAIYRRPKHYYHVGLSMDEDFKPVDDKRSYELKGGGFQIGSFSPHEDDDHKSHLPLELYLEEEFIAVDGKTMSTIVDGGVLITNADYHFTMPAEWKKLREMQAEHEAELRRLDEEINNGKI